MGDFLEKPGFDGGGRFDPARERVKINDPEDGETFGDIEPGHSAFCHGERLRVK